jgi:SagB-type dehydrogenase family enzyme
MRRLAMLEKMFGVILSFALACVILGIRVSDAAIVLPNPSLDGKVSVEKAIQQRRTIRDFKETPLSIPHLAQLLWAAQGITDPKGVGRSAPPVVLRYPLDIYVIVGKRRLIGLGRSYHYALENHSISSMNKKDLRRRLAASLGQMWMAELVCLSSHRSTRGLPGRYGDRIRYAQIEAGHVRQNLFLQAEALGLGAGIVGAFNDTEVVKVMGIPREHEPLLIMPVGYKN